MEVESFLCENAASKESFYVMNEEAHQIVENIADFSSSNVHFSTCGEK